MRDFIRSETDFIRSEMNDVLLMLQSDMEGMRSDIKKTIRHEIDMLLSDLYRDYDNIMSMIDPKFTPEDPPQEYKPKNRKKVYYA